MTAFELILVTDEVTPDQEDLIYDEYDALISTHSDSSRLVVTVRGTNILDGAHRLLGFLRSSGVQPRHFSEDFVTRADIAERAEVTRQAVGLWVRGERHSGFPQPYAPVAGGIWLFGEVDAWLRANHAEYDVPETAFPSRDDHIALAAMLRHGVSAAAPRIDVVWQVGSTVSLSETRPTTSRGLGEAESWLPVATIRRADYKLAA